MANNDRIDQLHDLERCFEDRDFRKAEGWIRKARSSAVELLDELIQIPSVNPPGEQYHECALLLSQRLRDLGFEPHLIRVPPHELQHLGLPLDHPRPSVLASLGSNRADAPTLHFHGHYDVMPSDSASMFRLQIKGDTAWGRGTADMKGGIVSLLLAMSALRPLASRFGGRVLLSLVPDEETGGNAGTSYLFRSGALPPGGLGMLTPEPTGGGIWNGNRGAISQLLTVRGKMAHVALQHQGRNAFEGLLELGRMLQQLKSDVESRSFGDNDLGIEGPLSILLIGGLSRGGTNFNVVPKAASFSIDRRFHPQEEADGVERELEAVFQDFRHKGWTLDVQNLQRGAASLTPAGTQLVQTMAQVISSVAGEQPRIALCPGILETRYFLAHGIPGLAYGPGELEVSHTPRECVSITRILQVAQAYARMAWFTLSQV
ncbi:MAG: ArgE/DapE family deacylase [Candidatus Eisenbacteria sp.]|nr:ArgE/DapE family deacylase [Candidatus Eisenbacteria bacterium]